MLGVCPLWCEHLSPVLGRLIWRCGLGPVGLSGAMGFVAASNGLTDINFFVLHMWNSFLIIRGRGQGGNLFQIGDRCSAAGINE